MENLLPPRLFPRQQEGSAGLGGTEMVAGRQGVFSAAPQEFSDGTSTLSTELTGSICLTGTSISAVCKS